MSMQQNAEADRLKGEGNALFAKNDFSAAYNKYTQALHHDDKNAILYCNRAACSLGLNSGDLADQATELDPAYAKAWSRLAAARTGLNRPDLAVKAWERAVAALPIENMTAAQQKQKAQYKAELATAKAKLEDLKARPMEPQGAVSMQNGQLPWNRAAAMLPELERTGVWESSEWQRALIAMKEGRPMHTSRGPGYFGRQGVIEGLTNALVADTRVFHISDPNFLEMYNRQMMFEFTQSKAWTDNGSREVITQVPKRLRTEGWDSVRPALSLTVRGWVMRAFMEDNFKNNSVAALDFYTSAVEVLRWGQEAYKDVPFSDKGQIFQPTFIRGVKRLRLEAFMKAYKMNPGPNSKFPLSELLAGADELLAEIGTLPDRPNDECIGFYLSFFPYAVGSAHALRGFYYLHTAINLEKTRGLTEEVGELYGKAASEYKEAALKYPTDDEHHAGFLQCSFDSHYNGGAPARDLLDTLDRLKDSIPPMKRIWEFTANAVAGRDFVLKQALQIRQQLLDKIANGTIQEQDKVYKPGKSPVKT
ncbi:hypothetical protein L226DRAFT_541311 [Lentinus tigrinus ALCF2SS1-7]|uniref:uncharacterized protein n=1 Tax=Lentinus tigrinus ALCF2SS1-7 TaxID=1328758 RepID=UPI001166235B|nr:hypothetical protein L226DRAFT_541311 [Lentinus tigrinus ALCF2SS1-7]